MSVSLWEQGARQERPPTGPKTPPRQKSRAPELHWNLMRHKHTFYY